MGQKVNAVGLRLGINKTWDSRWFATGKNFANRLHEDIAIRAYIKKHFYIIIKIYPFFPLEIFENLIT